MATTTATTAAASYPASGHGFAGSKKTARGSVTITAGPTAADVYEMLRLPKGAIVTGGRFFGKSLEVSTSGAALDIDVGTAADTDRFGNFGVLSPAAVAGVKPEVGYNYPLGGTLLSEGFQTMTAETVVQLTVVASVTLFTTGGGALNLEVDYVMPCGFSTAIAS